MMSPTALPTDRPQAPAKAENNAVHISIGRIEVRANAPAPTSPAFTPASSATPAAHQVGLGLTDYLRGDDGRPR